MSYSYPFREVDENTKLAVWSKGRIVPGVDKTGTLRNPSVWRYDAYGKLIKYSEHGNTESDVGWEIDHVVPQALGGRTALENLQPLHWENNRAKGNNHPWSPTSP
jgi:5-methylcytosine-specific restriction endonuclease McrA